MTRHRLDLHREVMYFCIYQNDNKYQTTRNTISKNTITNRNCIHNGWRKKHPNRDEPEFRKRNFERTNTTHKFLKRTKPLNPDNFNEKAIYDIYINSGYRMDWNDFIDKFKRDELKLYMNTKEF